MRKSEIRKGGHYTAKVSGKLTTVRVDDIRTSSDGTTVYDVTNLTTGRMTTFRSAAKFRAEVVPPVAGGAQDSAPADKENPFGVPVDDAGGEQGADPTPSAAAVPSAGATGAGTPAPASSEGEQRPDPMTSAHAPAVGPSATASPSPDSAAGPVACSGNGSLAARIASNHTAQRAPGSPVAGMVPNAEQEDILAVVLEMFEHREGPRVVVVGAGAGSGKTAQLCMIEQILYGHGQYTAFNRPLVDKSCAKFVKADCKSTHQLAYHAVGKLYSHRLPREGQGGRMRSAQIANVLGIGPLVLELAEKDSEGKPRTKRLTAEFLAGQVMQGVKRFCMSADRIISGDHLRYIDGIDEMVTVTNDDGSTSRRRSRDNNDRVKEYLLPFVRKAWDDLSRTDGVLPFQHDHYVKIWQLGEGAQRPIIAADYIMLDEYQDTAPVFLDVLMQQTHALLVLVGDDNQRIYEWRGAVNAGDYFPDAPRRLLSQSYRFGQIIADVANSVLTTLEEPTQLRMRGNPTIPSRVGALDAPRCYLYRTNAGAIGRLMQAIKDGKKPHLIGKSNDIVSFCKACIELKARRPTQHPELSCFESWQEVREYVKQDEGEDLRLMVKLMDDFTPEAIMKALECMPDEKSADLVISTAHKSKGMEWDSVYLGGDFPAANRMTDSDRRLLYVAVTRAKLVLDISECPPFCGQEQKAGEERHWVPGLTITYTVPMPVEGQQTAAPPVQVQTQPTVQAVRYTWARWGDRWCVRGPANVPLDTAVKVERKDGGVKDATLRTVIARYPDAWVYGVD